MTSATPDQLARGKRYLTLDAMRGVAAFFVVMRHAEVQGWSPHYSHLAVDLFFLLSGFVLSYAYDERLAAGLRFGKFMAFRLQRLAPIHLFGAILGWLALALA